MPTVKNVGEPCAGEPHARFEVAAGGIWHQSAHGRAALAPPADPTTPDCADPSRSGVPVLHEHPRRRTIVAVSRATHEHRGTDRGLGNISPREALWRS